MTWVAPPVARRTGPRGEPYDGWSPAVVGEGLVGLGHLVGVLALLHRGTEAVGGVEDLVHQALGHRLLTTVRGIPDQPAQRLRLAVLEHLGDQLGDQLRPEHGVDVEWPLGSGTLARH